MIVLTTARAWELMHESSRTRALVSAHEYAYTGTCTRECVDASVRGRECVHKYEWTTVCAQVCEASVRA